VNKFGKIGKGKQAGLIERICIGRFLTVRPVLALGEVEQSKLSAVSGWQKLAGNQGQKRCSCRQWRRRQHIPDCRQAGSSLHKILQVSSG
jgi:hypothetical protein